MALLDQLFRLRGAPRATGSPITLGALAAALKPAPAAAGEPASARPAPAEPPVSGTTEPAELAAPPVNVPPAPAASAEAPANGSPKPSAPMEPPVSVPLAPPVPPPPAPPPEPAATPAPEPTAPVLPPPPLDPRPAREGAVRFNPFAISAEPEPLESRAVGVRKPRRAASPCLEDPTLPPLQLTPHLQVAASEPVIVLGAKADVATTNGSEALRQIERPAVRLAPLRPPSAQGEPTEPKPPRVLKLRLEIEAEAALDVVAYKKYAAAFPGVVKCVFSDARD